MQTFLPYADFDASAAVLDSKRLGKQRVETLQIFQVLTGLRWDNARGVIETYEPRGWRTHPAVLAWAGYEAALCGYQRAVCLAWTSRGFADTCLPKTVGLLERSDLSTRLVLPPWMGDPDLHISHQSNLIRKAPDFYAPLFPGVPGDIEYVWPAANRSVERVRP